MAYSVHDYSARAYVVLPPIAPHILHERGGRVGPEPSLDDNLASFRLHLQAAAKIELSTIPLYLYAWLSTPSSDSAHSTIIKIAKQEMAHLAIVCNVFSAVFGKVDAFDPTDDSTFPKYGNGAIMFNRVPPLPLDLSPLTASALQTFIQVEAPSDGSFHGDDMHYKSLQEFYDAVIKCELILLFSGTRSTSCRIVCDKVPSAMWQTGPDFAQYTSDTIPGTDGAVTPTRDNTSAQTALTQIIIEGEGSSPTDPKSHYNKFKAMADEPHNPLNLAVSPKTGDYKDPTLRAISDLFDAVFTDLVMNVQAVSNAPSADAANNAANNIANLMGGCITPLARWIITQPYDSGNPSGPLAGPCFLRRQPDQGTDTRSTVISILKNLPPITDPKLKEAIAGVQQQYSN